MQFVYPLFLFAALSLLIPVLIHLFHLRRFKTVYFPHSRFLQQLQIVSKKQRSLREKLLLALRLLFLAALVGAFAQPFFGGNRNEKTSGITAIFVDNSQSMGLKQGQRSLLDLAKEKAAQIIAQTPGTFVILSADGPAAYNALSKDAALQTVAGIQPSGRSATTEATIAALRGILPPSAGSETVLYYCSDFQKNAFVLPASSGGNIRFAGVQIERKAPSNIYIDSAWFSAPVFDENAKLIVRSKYSGSQPEAAPVLQLQVNGKAASAATLHFDATGKSTDTLSLRPVNAGWHKLLLSLNDAEGILFDDSFFIAAKPKTQLSVSVVNEHGANVYLNAALRSAGSFRASEFADGQALPAAPADLTILTGADNPAQSTVDGLLSALQKGKNVCIFFSPEAMPEGLSAWLQKLGGVTVAGKDTAAQKVSDMAKEHPLIAELFDYVPENVQLPFAREHFILRGAPQALSRDLFSFSDGDPFLSVSSVGAGNLILCATPADDRFGNFQSGWFFVPLLYQMANTASVGSIYAFMAGSNASALVEPAQDPQAALHLLGNNADFIPPQKPEGKSILVAPGKYFSAQGFYHLNNRDTALLAANFSRSESDLSVWTLSELKNMPTSIPCSWQNAGASDEVMSDRSASSFPLWKLCCALALALLAAETFVLVRKQPAPKQAPETA